jgi:hypothetical protein
MVVLVRPQQMNVREPEQGETNGETGAPKQA